MSLVCGKRNPVTPGNMWDIIRSYVRTRQPILNEELINLIHVQPPAVWPPKVVANPSVQVVGSIKWIRGYIRGAVREGYLADVSQL